MYTRREFGVLAVGALALPRALSAAESIAGGVRLGVQTYSFREMPRPEGGDMVDVVIGAMTECGLTECELFAPHVEPRMGTGRGRPAPDSPEAQKARADLRAWRLATPLDHFRAIRKKFDAAGISVFGYNYSFNGSFTDEEIDRGFEIAKALGAEVITASTTLPIAKRVAHHADITNIHLKDRKKSQGDNMPWGEGDTPIREVLQLMKKERWPIRAYVEYEYRGAGTPVEEVKKCYAYAKQALA